MPKAFVVPKLSTTINLVLTHSSYSRLLIIGTFAFYTSGVLAMETMGDEELSAVAGQTLFSADYVAPSDSGNPSNNIGFYRLGIDAQVDLNANINKLQLGCGGDKGAGCDIDIDKLSLTGMAVNGTNVAPFSDFTLYRPFFEIAIKNPGIAATREVVGFRMGAQEIWGIMSIGTGPSVLNNDPATHTGINSFSGSMTTYVENVLIPSYLCIDGANASHSACNLSPGVLLGNSTVNTDQPNTGDNIFTAVLNRATSVNLPQNPDGSCSNCMKAVPPGALSTLTLTATLNEDLRFMHQMRVGADANNNQLYDVGEGTKDFYLSIQKQDVAWQDQSTLSSWSTAQKGWWMSVPNVLLGNATAASVYIGLTDVLSTVNLTNVDMGQRPADNCFGNLIFC
jgi:hypothetical protein